MISPLAISTLGDLSPSSKRVLTLATLGWLVTAAIVEPPQPTPQPIVFGRTWPQTELKETPYTYPETEVEEYERRRRIRDEQDIKELLKIIITCLG